MSGDNLSGTEGAALEDGPTLTFTMGNENNTCSGLTGLHVSTNTKALGEAESYMTVNMRIAQPQFWKTETV